MSNMMGRARLGEHPDYDTKEAAEFGHETIVTLKLYIFGTIVRKERGGGNLQPTDNAIIPLKERVVDEFFDPIGGLFRMFRQVLRGGVKGAVNTAL
jgi:hypothetical protein